MKKITLLAITVAIAVSTLGQTAPASHSKCLFKEIHRLQGCQRALKVSSANPKQRLDSAVDVYAKTEFTYDNQANCTLQTSYEWNSSKTAWIISQKVELVYGRNGKDSLDIGSDWNSSTSEWEKMYKDEYKYDKKGNDSLDFNYEWNSSTNAWATSTFKGEYKYDRNGRDSLVLWYNWNSSSAAWVNTEKQEFTYDSNNNCASEIDYDGDNSGWKPEEKCELTYNTSYSIDDLIIPFNSGLFQNMPTTESFYGSYNSSMSLWTELRSEEIFYYSTVNENTGVSNIADKGTLKAIVLNGKLLVTGILAGESIAVYNLQGVAVYNHKVVGNTVSINLPQAGLYIVSNSTQRIKVINGSL